MKILQLCAENVKRIQAVDITPRGHVVEIAGRNEQGKSSVLDSIWYALGGEGAIPPEPIRHGEKSASISLDLGELRVTRTWTRSGRTYLTVENADGTKPKSPQSLLNELTGRLSFDPIAFVHQKPAEQRATLINLLGLDEKLAAITDKAKDARAMKKTLNNELDRLRLELKAMPPDYATAPDTEIDVAALSAQVETMIAHNGKIDEVLNAINTQETVISHDVENIARLKAELANAERLLQQKQIRLNELRDQYKALGAPHDLDPIRSQIATANATNKLVAKKQRAAAILARGNAIKNEINAIDIQIDQLTQSRIKLLENATYPVAGLAFDDDGLTYNGVPFSQASQAVKLRVSIAIGMAMNPTLRVITVRDGNDLDDNALAALYAMMQEHDYQLWIERIHGSECAVVIEDGRVVENMINVKPLAALSPTRAADAALPNEL